MEQLALYVEQGARRGRRAKRLPIYVGLAVLLAAASLVAINASDGSGPSPIRIVQPKAGSACTTPPNGFLWTKTEDGTTLQVCISQEGNINQINYPTTAANRTQINFDGYCLKDLDSNQAYHDFSPPSTLAPFGLGPATLTVGPSSNNFNPITVTRTSFDGKYQLTQFIKINFQPRSIFVGMTVKNLDSVTHRVWGMRRTGTAINGNPFGDQFSSHGDGGLSGFPKTAQATDGNSLLLGATQPSVAFYEDMNHFSSGAPFCLISAGGPSGGPSVMGAVLTDSTQGDGLKRSILAPGASANVGKFVYRMV